MCGRFALTVPQTAVSELFGATPVDLRPAPPRWNICPTQQVEAILLGEEGREHRQLRWGLLPRWYGSPTDGPLLINARGETIAEKPAFRDSVRSRRCLIPADGFYEWRREGERKQPFWIHPAEDELVAFAGIWRVWRGAEDEEIATCAIVTTEAGEALRGIHHREPVAVMPEDRGLWLGEEGKGAALLMRAAPDGFYAFRKVSPRVNKAREDDPELIAPMEE